MEPMSVCTYIYVHIACMSAVWSIYVLIVCTCIYRVYVMEPLYQDPFVIKAPAISTMLSLYQTRSNTHITTIRPHMNGQCSCLHVQSDIYILCVLYYLCVEILSLISGTCITLYTISGGIFNTFSDSVFTAQVIGTVWLWSEELVMYFPLIT